MQSKVGEYLLTVFGFCRPLNVTHIRIESAISVAAAEGNMIIANAGANSISFKPQGNATLWRSNNWVNTCAGSQST